MPEGRAHMRDWQNLGTIRKLKFLKFNVVMQRQCVRIYKDGDEVLSRTFSEFSDVQAALLNFEEVSRYSLSPHFAASCAYLWTTSAFTQVLAIRKIANASGTMLKKSKPLAAEAGHFDEVSAV